MTLSPEYRNELRQLAFDLIHDKIKGLLNDRISLMEQLPYVHLTREEDEEVLDFVEESIRRMGAPFLGDDNG